MTEDRSPKYPYEPPRCPQIQKCTGAVVITRCFSGHLETRPESQTSFTPLYSLLFDGLLIFEVQMYATFLHKSCSFQLCRVIFTKFHSGLIQNYNFVGLYIDLYINHIMSEAGAPVVLRRRGSEHHDIPLQPLHLSLLSTNPKSLEAAKILPENLLDSFLWM
ncbi:RNA binding [Musa troglodytarum]|uniref:RNA binding n=1 Tax=Musa troglodytarum TaxID=320322 RepID=A0A9E7J8W3_9LILI|nr:RNA binding [Musa troglodytarum]